MAQKDDLTFKQREFCVNYVMFKDGEKAAISAGYSPKGAKQQAHALLKMPKVAAQIALHEERRAIRNEIKVEIKADETLQEMATLAFASLEPFLVIEPDQEVRIDLSQATSEQLKTLKTVKVTTNDRFDAKSGELIGRTTRTEISLWDKQTALQTLMRHLGLFAAENAQQGAAVSQAMLDAVAQLHRSNNSKVPIRTINGHATVLPDDTEGD